MVTRLLFENELEQMNPTSLLGVLPPNLQQMSVREKAAVYNQLVDQGFSSQQIRDIVEVELGPQSNANWGALQDIASSIRGTPFQQGGILESQFGDAGSWNFGAGSEYQNNMIVAPNAYFQRGGDVVVSDELFWNPNSPTGDALKQKVDQAKAAGNRAGVVITPYAVFQGKASNQQLINEIKNSGVDFVALDPYFGFGASKDELLNWTKDFIPQLNDLGLGVKLVTQGFAKAGLEQETRQYNEQLRSLPGVSEFVEFGLEDAPDLQGSPEWVSLSAQQDTAQATQPSTQGQSAASTAIEQQATMQAPQSAASVGEPVRAQQFSGLFGSGDVLANKAQEVLAASGRANDPRFADAIVGSFTQNGVVYNVQGDGSIQGVIETPTGAYLAAGFTPTGQQATEQLSTQFEQTSTDRLLGTLANAAIAAGTAAGLGPAGAGFLSAPAAAAAGTGTTTLFNTGDLQQALKAAALGGATAYGFQEFVNPMLQQGAYDRAFAAADAANMANAGLDANTIAANLQTYVDPVTATSLANSAATQAGSLSYANQLVAQGFTPTEIATALTDLGVSNTMAQSAASAAAEGITQIAAQDLVSNITYQPQVRNPIQASPGAIEVTGTAVQPGLLTAPAAAATGGLLGVPVQPTPVQTTAPSLLTDTQSVTVQGATTPAQVQAIAPAAAAFGAIAPSQAVQAQAPAQQVQVQTTTAAQDITADTASAVLSGLVGQPVSVAGAAQQVQVTGQAPTQQVAPEVAAALISAATGQQVTVAGQTIRPEATPETVGASAGGLLSDAMQTVQVQGASQQLTPDQASTIVSALAGQPVSVAGQQVQVTGQTEQQISPDAAAALISAAVGQQVTVAGQTISQPADSSLGAATGSLLQTVPVQSTTLPDQAQISAPAGAAAGSLVSQLVPIQTTTLPAQTDTAAPAGATVGGLLETVPVQSTTIPPQSQATAPVSTTVGAFTPVQTVPIESRPIPREEAQILTPIAAGTVAGVPVADVTVPRSSTGQIEGSTTVNPLVAAGLLGLGATTLAGGQGQTSQFDQAAFDAIINASRPTYSRGQFTPMFGPGGTGMYQIAPTDVYNYFGPPYGAGRFGALTQPFTLPGLLGPNMGLMATPTRGSSI